MIRFIYWLLVIIEVLLLLSASLLFIVTDSKSIKFIAETSLNSSKFTYREIEGNLFQGLTVSNLAYDNRELFSEATLHWNPLTLLYHKITLTKIDARGLELKNIISMVDDLSSSESESNFEFDYSLSLNSTHLDINPYLYEGIKLSSFVLDSGKINLKKDFILNADALHLKFDSDIVNVDLLGKIEESRLLVDNLDLKNISSEAITLLTKRLKAKYKSESAKSSENKKGFVPFKEIKVKHILGTMKPVKYGDFEIQKVTLLLDDGVVDPYNHYLYAVKHLDLKGKTNFGSIAYKGYVNKSTIHAKGDLFLSKELFSTYTLPLTYKALRKLPSKLTLNHSGVWLDIDHKLKKLLKVNSDFNIDVSKAHHKLSYIYAEDLIIDSEIKGSINYADDVEFNSKTVIDFDEGTTNYEGDIKLAKFKALPKDLADYLLKGLEGTFKGDTKGISVDIDSDLIEGNFLTTDYKKAKLELKSKKENIALSKLIPSIPKEYRGELLALKGNMQMEFKDMRASLITLDSYSNFLNLKTKMSLEKPYKILFSSTLPLNSSLREIDKKIHFFEFQDLEGSVEINNNLYKVDLHNSDALKLKFNYDVQRETFDKGVLSLGSTIIYVNTNFDKKIELKSNILNLQKTLKEVQRYYEVELPKLQGAVDFSMVEKNSGLFEFNLESPHIKYLSHKSREVSVTNLYGVKLLFDIDSNSNIEVKRYKFKIDDNEYISKFYSNKFSHLQIDHSKIIIKDLWLNNNILLAGDYSLDTQKGTITLKSKGYSYISKDFDLLFDCDLKTKISDGKFDISGIIDILGNTINYEVVGSDIVEDSDIIILQDALKSKESALQNFKFNLKINNKKPLKYSANNTNIEFFNDLIIVKDYTTDMMITGMTTITKGYYEMEDKKFILNESHLYFAGDVKKPFLDIKANYEKDQYNVHIFISGSTEEPIVNFNSEPYLTQQEILSLILFDGTGSSSGNGAEAYTLLGGTFAKGLMKSLGINIDHLLLGTNENDQLSLEIGTKISKNITVLYLHKNGLYGAEVRVEHGKHFETDIIIQQPNTSSIEFLYKQDR